MLGGRIKLWASGVEINGSHYAFSHGSHIGFSGRPHSQPDAFKAARRRSHELRLGGVHPSPGSGTASTLPDFMCIGASMPVLGMGPMVWVLVRKWAPMRERK